jgi:phenylacetate-coenzyme A ligase PaaK-like adenylate-forming protein
MRLLDRLYWTSFLAANVWGQTRYPFRPLPAIARDRDHAVRRMISHAFRCVPYYRRTLLQAGLAPGDSQGFDDLAKLPLIDASTVLAAPTDFLATTADLRRCVSLKTSGSSGMSRTIHVDRAALFRNPAQGERERSMMAAAVGRRSGYREAVIVLNSELAESSTPRVQRFL